MKYGLDRNIRLISKFETAQPGKQTIAVHILLNISWSKGDQTMDFGQLIEYNNRNIFFKNHAESEAGKFQTSLFSKETLYKVKGSGLQLSFNIFWKPSTCHTMKTNSTKLETIDPEISSTLIL